MKYVDPSGHYTVGDDIDPNDVKDLDPEDILREAVKNEYGFEFEDEWMLEELMQVLLILSAIAQIMGGTENFRGHYGNRTWLIRHHKGKHAGVASPSGYIELKAGFSDWTVAHELGHALDYANDMAYRKTLQFLVGAGKDEFWKVQLREEHPKKSEYWYDPGTSPPVNGVDANFNAGEDFAESFAAVILPDEAAVKGAKHNENPYDPYDWVAMNGGSYDFRTTPRGMYVLSILRQVP